MKIDKDAIRDLADLLNETGLTEIEVTDADKVIRVSRNSMISAHTMPYAPVMQPANQGAPDPAQPGVANLQPASSIAANHPGAIVSPMVGTAYAAPEPGASPFVRKGSTVKAGDTLVIIEAMKVMNPIKAEKSGTVTHVMIEDGQPVEFGDVLMVIE